MQEGGSGVFVILGQMQGLTVKTGFPGISVARVAMVRILNSDINKLLPVRDGGRMGMEFLEMAGNRTSCS